MEYMFQDLSKGILTVMLPLFIYKDFFNLQEVAYLT
jgi:hypothetical protein